MKKRFYILLVFAFMVVAPLALVGCDDDNANANLYRISYYADGNGINTLTVTKGENYSIKVIPKKVGYEFLGLFDAEEGGAKYVTSEGVCVSPYKESKSITLYPQYRVKEYYFYYDIGEGQAPMSFVQSEAVRFNESIELYQNLTSDNEMREFVGWFTAPNCTGEQISNAYGIIPDFRKLNESFVELANKNDVIRLYAGFKYKTCKVTFYLNTDGTGSTITQKIDYGTHINDVDIDRKVNGKRITAWSTVKDDSLKLSVFNDYICESEKKLYACEYTPVITFDSNGGVAVDDISVSEGTKITLPYPKRTGYTFVGWVDAGNNPYTSTTMPSESITLKAKWEVISH